MKFFTTEQLASYVESDPTLATLRQWQREGDSAAFGCHQWLQDSAPKRMIFHTIYGDLINATGKRILDVGGGFTAATRALCERNAYTVIDFMAHDSHTAVAREFASLDGARWINGDWAEWPLDPLSPEVFDVVIANDIFPNVDQRLVAFLDRFLQRCHELRVLLTYYHEPRAYKVRRVDADEVFHMLAWDGPQVARALQPFTARIERADLQGLATTRPSLYPNGRQVCAVTLRGDQSPNR